MTLTPEQDAARKWLEAQDDVIDCPIGHGRITLSACRARQAKQRHNHYKDYQRTNTRAPFCLCRAKQCPHYDPPKTNTLPKSQRYRMKGREDELSNMD